MKNNHQDFFYMCLRVKKFYRRNEKVLDENKLLPDYFIKLGQLTDRLIMNFENSISYSNSYSIERAIKREDLLKKSLIISQVLTDLKESIKYKVIEQLRIFVQLDYTELSALNEEDLISYTSNLYDLYLISETRLKNQGYKHKGMEQFANSLTLFALDYPMNKYWINRRKEGSLETLQCIDDIDEFLKEKLDLAIEEYHENKPKIFEAYSDARKIIPFDTGSSPDFSGELLDGNIITISQWRYDSSREFRMSVEGGNAIWGLSNQEKRIDYCRPINTKEKFNIKSRTIGPDGKYLLIQSIDPGQIIKYKLWVTES